MRLKIIILLIVCLSAFNRESNAQSYDFLVSATAIDTAITVGDNNPTDVLSITIDLGATSSNINKVMVLAAMNMQASGASTNGREAQYEIYNDRNSDVSGIILRQVQKVDDYDYGIGTLVHIFDVSALSGNITFTLEHQNNKGGAIRNIETIAYLTGIALTTDINDIDLYSSNKRLGSTAETTTSASYTGVSGLTTDAITLPAKGDIYVAASINGKETGGLNTVGEWVLQYQVNGGSTWTNIGFPILRTMSNNADEGIISLVSLARDLDADDYILRVAHRRESGSGTVATLNSNLVALALTHDNDGYFPSIYDEPGSNSIVIDQGSSGDVASEVFTSAADISSQGANLLVHAQYVAQASGLDGDEKLLAKHQLILDNGTSTQNAVAFKRLLSSNIDYGAGGFIGLAEDLDSSTEHIITINHVLDSIYEPSGDADTLNSFSVILSGFQTYDQPTYIWDGSASTDWNTAANWAENQVPVSSGYAVIPDIATEPKIASSMSVTRLSIASGSHLVIDSIGDLTVTADIFNADTISIKAGKLNSGSLIAKGEATGTASMDSYLNADEWHIVAAPVDSQAFNTFLTNAANNIPDKTGSYGLTHYIESSNSWSSYYTTATSGNFTPGQGYLMRRETKDSTVNYTGKLVVQDVPVSLTSVASGWNALGNPYTSAIGATSGASSAANFLTFNLSQLDPNYTALYLWDEQVGYDGTQKNYKVIGNAGYNDNLNLTELNLDKLQAGQGFLVKSKPGGASVSFTRDMQVHEKTESVLKSSARSWDGFKIVMTGEQNTVSTILTFHEGMTLGLDQSYDAGLLGANATFSIASRLLEEDEEIDFNIQCLPELMYNDMTIPLNINLQEEMEASISAAGVLLPDDYQLILEDRKHERFVDLLLEDNAYSLFENSPVQGDGRFFIHLLTPESTSSISDQIKSQLVEAYYFNETIRIRHVMHQDARAMLFDMNGRILGSYQLQNQGVNDITVPGLQEGIYVLVVTEGNEHENFKIPVF